jgi:hypothetical protein
MLLPSAYNGDPSVATSVQYVYSKNVFHMSTVKYSVIWSLKMCVTSSAVIAQFILIQPTAT